MDSRLVLGWITIPDLSLSRLSKSRVDKILLVAPSDEQNYVNTAENPADVGARDGAFKTLLKDQTKNSFRRLLSVRL